ISEPRAAMFGISFGELLVVAIVLLIAVGPSRMPVLVKAIARGLREFRRATEELRESVGLDDLFRDDEIRTRRARQRFRPNPVSPSDSGSCPEDSVPMDSTPSPDPGAKPLQEDSTTKDEA